MKIEEFFRSGIGMVVAIVFTLGIFAIIGYNFWGWFGGSKKWRDKTLEELVSDGFPANPKDGDKYTKDGKVYVFKKMEINCITTPCPDGMWVIFNSGAVRMANNNDSVANILRMAMQEADSLRVANDQAKIDLINKKLKENNITDIVALSKGGSQPTGRFKSCNCGGYWYSWVWRDCGDFCNTSPT